MRAAENTLLLGSSVNRGNPPFIHRLSSRQIYSEGKGRSTETNHFHATSTSFPLHNSPIKVGDVPVAHPLEGIRSQR
jgi:hypothetical protein